MAIEIRNDISSRETRAPMLGDPIITSETVERLKIPDEVALQPQNVLAFIASQWGRYNDIVSRPEIKAQPADIPPCEGSMALRIESAMTSDEQAALDSWNQERFGQTGAGATLSIQTEGSAPLDINRLDAEVQGHIDEMRRLHPDWWQQQTNSRSTGTPDIMSAMFSDQLTGELNQESAEERKKWDELLIAAKGSPDMINSIMGMRHAQKVSQQMGKLVEMYRNHVDGMDKLAASFDLSNSGGHLTQADLAKFNADFARAQSDTSSLFQAITRIQTEYDRTIQFVHTTNTEITQPLKTMIQNMRT